MATHDEQFYENDDENEIADIEEFQNLPFSNIEAIEISVPPPTQFGFFPSDIEKQATPEQSELQILDARSTVNETELVSGIQSNTNQNASNSTENEKKKIEQNKPQISSLGNPISVQSSQKQGSFGFQVEKQSAQAENHKKSLPHAPRSFEKEHYPRGGNEKRPYDQGISNLSAKETYSNQEVINTRNIDDERTNQYSKDTNPRISYPAPHASAERSESFRGGKVKNSPHKHWSRDKNTPEKDNSEFYYEAQKKPQVQSNPPPQGYYDPKDQTSSIDQFTILNYAQVKFQADQADERVKIAEDRAKMAEDRATIAEERAKIAEDRTKQVEEQLYILQHSQRQNLQNQFQGQQQDYQQFDNQQSYSSQSRQQNYLPQGRQQNYPPQGRSQNYPSQGRPQNFSSQGRPQSNSQNYIPQSNSQNYIPQSNSQNYLPQSNSQNFPSQSNPQNFPPQSNSQNYSPRGHPQTYPRQPRAQNHQSQTRSQDYYPSYRQDSPSYDQY